MARVSLPILNVLGGSGTVSREVKLFLKKVNSRNNVPAHETAILRKNFFGNIAYGPVATMLRRPIGALTMSPEAIAKR